MLESTKIRYVNVAGRITMIITYLEQLPKAHTLVQDAFWRSRKDYELSSIIIP
jgi:hypothetical protein